MIISEKFIKFLKFIFLDTYALIFFVLSSLVLYFISIFITNIYLVIICVVLFFFFGRNGFVIHSRLRKKYNSYLLLKARNSMLFRSSTFYKYMDAPCTRLVVILVLIDLKKIVMYRQIKKELHQIHYSKKNDRILLYNEGILTEEIILK